MRAAQPPFEFLSILIVTESDPEMKSATVATCSEIEMSVMLESLLDNERRVRCGVNDAAIATGRPITSAYSPPYWYGAPTRFIFMRCRHESERSNDALIATNELC
jgi:hypothetical protein